MLQRVEAKDSEGIVQDLRRIRTRLCRFSWREVMNKNKNMRIVYHRDRRRKQGGVRQRVEDNKGGREAIHRNLGVFTQQGVLTKQVDSNGIMEIRRRLACRPYAAAASKNVKSVFLSNRPPRIRQAWERVRSQLRFVLMKVPVRLLPAICYARCTYCSYLVCMNSKCRTSCSQRKPIFIITSLVL